MVAVGTYTYSQPADTHVPTLYGLIQEVLVDGPVTLLECFFAFTIMYIRSLENIKFNLQFFTMQS